MTKIALQNIPDHQYLAVDRNTGADDSVIGTLVALTVGARHFSNVISQGA